MNYLTSNYRSLCPISISLEMLGDKWSLLILRDMIFCGSRHYKDFLSSEEKISTNILANRLKALEADGFIERSPDPESAKQIIYLPSEKALDLIPVLIELIAWGTKQGGKTSNSFLAKLKADRDQLIRDIRSKASKKSK